MTSQQDIYEAFKHTMKRLRREHADPNGPHVMPECPPISCLPQDQNALGVDITINSFLAFDANGVIREYSPRANPKERVDWEIAELHEALHGQRPSPANTFDIKRFSETRAGSLLDVDAILRARALAVIAYHNSISKEDYEAIIGAFPGAESLGNVLRAKLRKKVASWKQQSQRSIWLAIIGGLELAVAKYGGLEAWKALTAAELRQIIEWYWDSAPYSMARTIYKIFDGGLDFDGIFGPSRPGENHPLLEWQKYLRIQFIKATSYAFEMLTSDTHRNKGAEKKFYAKLRDIRTLPTLATNNLGDVKDIPVPFRRGNFGHRRALRIRDTYLPPMDMTGIFDRPSLPGYE